MSIGPYGMTKTEFARYQRARDERDAARIAEMEAAAKAEALNKLENERMREERKRKLDAERQARRDADDRKYEQSVEPHKQRLASEWLSAHPDRTMKDFESIAWPHMVQAMRAADQTETQKAYADRLRAEAAEEDGGPGGAPFKRSWDQIRARALDSDYAL
ncbi:MAG: hypothetical protein ACREA2_02580 [Blastocatellia bacterium]